MMDMTDVRVALKVSTYRKKILAKIKASLIVIEMIREEGKSNSNSMTLSMD